MRRGAILSIEGLKKHFGGIVATDNVTLDVAAGDLQCIIGPNGAGKSTFFALLCGIHKLDGGRIVFKGKDITRMLPSHRVREGLGTHLPDQSRVRQSERSAEPGNSARYDSQ